MRSRYFTFWHLVMTRVSREPPTVAVVRVAVLPERSRTTRSARTSWQGSEREKP